MSFIAHHWNIPFPDKLACKMNHMSLRTTQLMPAAENKRLLSGSCSNRLIGAQQGEKQTHPWRHFGVPVDSRGDVSLSAFRQPVCTPSSIHQHSPLTYWTRLWLHPWQLQLLFLLLGDCMIAAVHEWHLLRSVPEPPANNEGVVTQPVMCQAFSTGLCLILVSEVC